MKQEIETHTLKTKHKWKKNENIAKTESKIEDHSSDRS